MDKKNNSKFTNNEERENFLEEKFEEIQEIQEADLLVDFDQAIKEKAEKPLYIKFIGKTFEVPRKMPFKFATFFFRYCYKKEHGKIKIDVPEERLFQFMQLMFGNDFLTSIERNKKNISLELVFDVISVPILDKWGYGIDQKKKAMHNNTQKKI